MKKKQTCIAVPKNSPVLLDKLNQTIDNVKRKNLIDQYMTKQPKICKMMEILFLNMAVFIKGIKKYYFDFISRCGIGVYFRLFYIALLK